MNEMPKGLVADFREQRRINTLPKKSKKERKKQHKQDWGADKNLPTIQSSQCAVFVLLSGFGPLGLLAQLKLTLIWSDLKLTDFSLIFLSAFLWGVQFCFVLFFYIYITIFVFLSLIRSLFDVSDGFSYTLLVANTFVYIAYLFTAPRCSQQLHIFSTVFFFFFFLNLNSGIASVPQASSGMTEVFLSQHVIKQLKL